jgi:hypothetical protein
LLQIFLEIFENTHKGGGDGAQVFRITKGVMCQKFEDFGIRGWGFIVVPNYHKGAKIMILNKWVHHMDGSFDVPRVPSLMHTYSQSIHRNCWHPSIWSNKHKFKKIRHSLLK